MTRKPLLILLLILFLTALQVQWASPVEGYDAQSTHMFSPEILGIYPGVVLLFLLAVYWLLANYITFDLRVASWSTFSPAEIWIHVLPASVISIAVMKPCM